MSATAHTPDRGIANRPRDTLVDETPRRGSTRDGLDLARVFANTVARYLFTVLPQVNKELARWRNRIGAIPDAQLRNAARQALRKRGNVEGAALFATLVPAAHRRAALRALVAFQMSYDYLDMLSELPSEDPIANGHQLHQALLAALRPGVAHTEYYARNAQSDDGQYLAELLQTCSEALVALPSYALFAPIVSAAARRIVVFQTLNLSASQGGHEALERWAGEAGPATGELEWWETAAAAGSSLGVYALIAAAADPHLDPRDACAIEGAYFPWIGALHSLLDSLVDRREDHAGGRPCLLDYYPSTDCAATRLGALAHRARKACAELHGARAHRVIVTAMASYYLSAPESCTREADTIARALTRALGVPLRVAIAMFRLRRLFRAITGRSYT